MQKAAALVLYSNFETFGCVNIEAMACGLPVIISDIPVFKEYLQQGVTGWFAGFNNPARLAEVLRDFINSAGAADAHMIANEAQQFDYNTVGRLIAGLYNGPTGK
jgi:glycosyltransferase involved in cell wall biosynthesis